MKIIAFKASFCGPCKMMAPVVKQLQEENADIVVEDIDIDANPEIAAEYNVRNIPTFIFLKDGEIKERVMGAVPKAKLQEKINIYK